MERKGFAEEHAILRHLSRIAPQMVKLRDHDNLTEFVLHELCCQKGFNVDKAAYFIDNPDFDCLKGVAGFYRPEAYPTDYQSIWDIPEAFSIHMDQSPFNQQVRKITKNSVKKSTLNDVLLVDAMAHDLGFKKYDFYSWDMKYDNHGIFLFERLETECYSLGEHVKNGASLLSFCPLF